MVRVAVFDAWWVLAPVHTGVVRDGESERDERVQVVNGRGGK